MKKSLAVLLTATLAGALTVTAAGCAGSSKNLASLSSNWYADTTFKNIQPTFTEDAAQKYTYAVTQPEKEGNGDYIVAFADGTYTTEFYAKKITAAELETITLEKWRDDYTSALGSEGYMYLYYYKSSLSLPSVTFTVGQDSKTYDGQTVESESYFLSVADYLAPVYTLRTVHRALPAELRATSLENACFETHAEYESFYSLGGNSVLSRVTDLSAEPAEPYEYEAGGFASAQNSLFDYTYLDIVVRAMRGLYSSSSLTFSLYTPGLQPRVYTASVGDSALSSENAKAEEQLSAVQEVLQGKGLFTPQPVENEDGTQTLSKLKTKSVAISYSGGNFSGGSQTYWFAVGENSNETRTVMVKYLEPLPYALGSLEYVLKSID